jgi:hypothetical protein
MDTSTFLVRREALQADLEAMRAAVTVNRRHRQGLWWLGLPLVPLAGLVVARRIDAAAHPLVRGFVMAGVKRLATRLATAAGLASLRSPAFWRRLLGAVR